MTSPLPPIVAASRAPRPFSHAARDLFALLKPRVMSLVVFTAAAGLLAAPVSMEPWRAAVSVLLIALAAGAAGSLNMWREADADRLMRRTRRRPLPDGRLPPKAALILGVSLTALAVGALWVVANPLAAALVALTTFHYVVVYTIWLKPRTPQSIVIGGAAGALPPAIGWIAATGVVSLEPVVLFAVIFLWTPPHFWALCIRHGDDYRAAGFPMMTELVGVKRTCTRIFVYALLLAPAGCLPWIMGFAGPIYAMTSVTLGGAFVWRAWRLLRAGDDAERGQRAGGVFGFSIAYLFFLFLALIVETAAASLGVVL